MGKKITIIVVIIQRPRIDWTQGCKLIAITGFIGFFFSFSSLSTINNITAFGEITRRKCSLEIIVIDFGRGALNNYNRTGTVGIGLGRSIKIIRGKKRN